MEKDEKMRKMRETGRKTEKDRERNRETEYKRIFLVGHQISSKLVFLLNLVRQTIHFSNI